MVVACFGGSFFGALGFGGVGFGKRPPLLAISTSAARQTAACQAAHLGALKRPADELSLFALFEQPLDACNAWSALKEQPVAHLPEPSKSCLFIYPC